MTAKIDNVQPVNSENWTQLTITVQAKSVASKAVVFIIAHYSKLDTQAELYVEFKHRIIEINIPVVSQIEPFFIKFIEKHHIFFAQDSCFFMAVLVPQRQTLVILFYSESPLCEFGD